MNSQEQMGIYKEMEQKGWRDQRRRRLGAGHRASGHAFGKEYLDVVAALPKGNQSLDDSDPNKFPVY